MGWATHDRFVVMGTTGGTTGGSGEAAMAKDMRVVVSFGKAQSKKGKDDDDDDDDDDRHCWAHLFIPAQNQGPNIAASRQGIQRSF